jgi:hypothetical protein
MVNIKYIILQGILDKYREGKINDIQFLDLVTTIMRQHDSK